MGELLKLLAAAVAVEVRQALARRAAARAHAQSATAATRVQCDWCGASVPADAASLAAHDRRHPRGLL